MGVSKLFDISRRSLLTYQQALSVTSNNVANADNENYSRQRTQFASVSPDIRGQYTFGSGVKLADIERVRNQILDMQIYKNKPQQQASEKQASILTNIETLYSEPTEVGLSNLMNEFFNAWDELATDPTSTALRSSVVYAADNMTSKLQSVYEGMDKIKTDLKEDAASIVEQLNTQTSELQTVNEQIYTNSVVGYGVNDLLDKRDELLKSISEKANMNVTIDNYGVATVTIAGVYAVDRTHHTEFKVEEEANSKLAIKTADGNAKLAIKSGELYANIDSYSNLIPDYKKQLDDVAVAMMDNINSIHSSGYTMTEPPTTGIDFFSNYESGVLVINQDVLNDIKNIAISADGTDGNNEIALQIAEIRDQNLVNGNSISEAYNNLVGDIASKKQLNDQKTNTFDLVLNQLDQQVSSYSGISIDEEMTDVLKFQRSYDAAAKLISVADEILQTLLNV